MELRWGISTRGDHEADGEPLLQGFRLDDHPWRRIPASRLVARLGNESGFLPGLLPLLCCLVTERCCEHFQSLIGGQPDGVGDVLDLQMGVDGGDGKAGVGTELDGDLRPTSTDVANQPFENGECSPTGMRRPRTKDGRDELAGRAIEDQERMVHMLTIIPVVGDTFLLAMGGIIGTVEVEDNPFWCAVSSPFLEQGDGEAVTGFDVDRTLQTREGGLAGQIRPIGQTTADQREQRIGAQGIGNILVFIATGDLEDALPHQGLESAPTCSSSPLGDVGCKCGTETQQRIGFSEPAETTVTGELGTIEAGLEAARGEAEVDRLGHGASPLSGGGCNPPVQQRCLVLSLLVNKKA
jgi:hypothetical protein